MVTTEAQKSVPSDTLKGVEEMNTLTVKLVNAINASTKTSVEIVRLADELYRQGIRCSSRIKHALYNK